MTEKQKALVHRLQSSEEGKVLISLIEEKIDRIKDDVMDEKLTPSSGKEAIAKLKELAQLFQEKKAPKTSNKFT